MEENKVPFQQEEQPEVVEAKQNNIPFWITPLENPLTRADDAIQTGLTIHNITNLPASLSSKLNDQHIDSILKMASKEQDQAYKKDISNKIYRLVYFLVAVAGVVVFFVYLINAGVLAEMLNLIFAFAGGFGIGYGVKNILEKREK
jgi:hypothetical protein